MPQFAANLSMLFTEIPFMERFKAARQVGFKNVEFLFPYSHERKAIFTQLQESEQQLVLFDLPPGNWDKGEVGIANNPQRIEEFRKGVHEAAEWALTLNVERLNCLAGRFLNNLASTIQWQTLIDNFKYAADILGKHHKFLLIEPINRYDVPGYFIDTIDKAVKLLDEVNSPNLYIQFDAYHIHRTQGELWKVLRKNIDKIGHIQIADNPGRHQPQTGNVDYQLFLKEIDKLKYEGYVSLEYIPKPDTLASLKWIEDYGYSL